MTVSGEPGAVGWRFFLWWMLAFLNFPIDGFLALVLVGSVDGALSGALGGALALPLRGGRERRTPRGERHEPARIPRASRCGAQLLGGSLADPPHQEAQPTFAAALRPSTLLVPDFPRTFCSLGGGCKCSPPPEEAVRGTGPGLPAQVYNLRKVGPGAAGTAGLAACGYPTRPRGRRSGLIVLALARPTPLVGRYRGGRRG